MIPELSSTNCFWLILRPNWINVFSIHGEHGFWVVRKAIAHKEAAFSSHARYIRDRLEHNEEEAGEAARSHRQQSNIGNSSASSPSPLGGNWSLTPFSSTIPGQTQKRKDCFHRRRKRSLRRIQCVNEPCSTPHWFSGKHCARRFKSTPHHFNVIAEDVAKIVSTYRS